MTSAPPVLFPVEETMAGAGFVVEQLTTPDGPCYRLVDPAVGADCFVHPLLGAAVSRWRVGSPGGPIELLVPPERLSQLRDVPFCAGLPILFPFPNRIRGGRFTFRGVTYAMPHLARQGERWDACAHQAMHGLVDQHPWEVVGVAVGPEGASVTSEIDCAAVEDIRSQYPFPCRLRVTHTLAATSLTLAFEVHNTGARPLPMGLGIHPWFPTVFRPGAVLPQDLAAIRPEERQRARVTIPAERRWVLAACMPTGAVVPVAGDPHYDLREGPALGRRTYDDVWTDVHRSCDQDSAAVLEDAHGHQLRVGADAGFREWVLYAPPDRPVAVLEPYTCTTDAPNLASRGIDSGLITLPGGGQWRGRIVLRFAHAA